jgi:PAS domain S-box-containing protein
MQRRVRHLWVAAGLITAVIVLAAGALWQTWSAQRKEHAIALEQTEIRASQLAGAVAGRFDALVRSIDFMLFWLGAEYGVNDAEFQAVGKSLAASFPEGALQEVAVAGPDGKLTYSSLGRAGGVSIREQQYFTTHLGGGDRLFISKPIIGRLTKTWSIRFTRPILRRGRFAGVVVVSMSPQYISQVLASFELELEDNVTLLDNEGTFMAHSQRLSEVIGKTLAVDRPFNKPDGPLRGSYRVTSFTDGRDRIFGWERIPGTSLVASVGLDERKAMAPLEIHFRQAWTVAVVFALAILAFGLLVLALLVRLSRRQQVIAASEARFRAIYEQAGVGVGIVTAGDARWLSVNQRLCDIVGYTQPEMLALNFVDMTHPDDRQAHVVHQRRACAGEITSFTLEKRYLRKDGAVVWVSISSSLVRDEAGAPEYYISVYEDITDRKRAEQRLRDDERQLNAVIESSSDGIIIADETQRIVLVNPAAERMYGHRSEEMIGAPMDRLVPERYRNAHQQQVQLFASEGVSNRPMGKPGRVTGLRADGTEFPADCSIARFEIQGKCYITATCRDVSEQVRMDRELRELNATLEQHVADRTAELEAANRQLESFSYSISHDLRAPLRAITGFTAMLQQDAAPKLNENERKLFERIRGNAGRMGALIDDLLEFTRMSRSSLRRTRVPLQSLVGEIIEELREAYPGTEVRVGDLPEITADRQMLRQALLNLIGNALKFSGKTGKPRVEIGCTVAGEETVYFVRDNGAGFDMRYADKLFGVFQRLHRFDEFEGTGVGLAIVHQIIQRHGGRVWAEGAPGQGATFFFTTS